LGAKLSSSYDGHALRWLLMVILAATAVTLIGAPPTVTGAVAIVGVAIVSALIVIERRAVRRRGAFEPHLTTILEGNELTRGVDVGKRNE
jgi:FtsH-binding integral membrane protein